MAIEYEILEDDEKDPLYRRRRSSSTFAITAFAAFALLLFLVIVTFPKLVLRLLSAESSSNGCVNPVRRREWRQLESAEQADYISAVKCFHDTPSILNHNSTLYDDFTWVHASVSMQINDTPHFLSWHRYLLHVYENLLQEVCEYNGHMVYWDWTLDWEDPSHSPVWSNERGFGGNGRGVHDPLMFINGNCVLDGPFANLNVAYFNDKYYPHCLERGFANDNGPGLFSGDAFHPGSVQQTLRQQDFFNFSKSLEYGAHNGLPGGVGGEFRAYSAPNDPVFYLHHTQLDRIWWQWQSANPSRLTEYNGPKAVGSASPASLQDVLIMLNLADDVLVAQIMDTESDLLCYTY